MNLPRARGHHAEYLIEAALLGLFMMSACLFGTLLGHPASPIARALPGPFAGRAIMGLAMGLTAVAIIYSPLGQRSGAHMNPATTLTFYRLGKIERKDAFFYVAAQFAGGLLGVAASWAFLGGALADPAVHFVATVPPAPTPAAAIVAFVAELALTFILMSVVLTVSNTPRIARFTGLCVGAIVWLAIAFEAPASGMSMNPARTFASALPAMEWQAIWVYFIAPPAGMLLAAEAFLRRTGGSGVFCAKLNHAGDAPCIFRCGYGNMTGRRSRFTGSGRERVPLAPPAITMAVAEF